jgi:hypothetical protein
MVHDVNAAILWTSINAAKYKGDPEKIVLAGQSAGTDVYYIYVYIFICIYIQWYIYDDIYIDTMIVLDLFLCV